MNQEALFSSNKNIGQLQAEGGNTMIPCILRRCEWAKDVRCLFMLGGWCPNQARRQAEEERIRQERMRRATEEAETLEMLRRLSNGQEDA